MKHKLINFILFQACWFGCVLGVAAGTLIPGLAAVSLLLIYQAGRSGFRQTELPLVLTAVAVGLFLDSLWIWTGVMTFALPGPAPLAAPVWILLLWVAFALTLNHSMVWLRRDPLKAALFAAVGSPLSYLAGERFGAVTFPNGALTMIIATGITWGLLLPALYYLADRLEQRYLGDNTINLLPRWSRQLDQEIKQ